MNFKFASLLRSVSVSVLAMGSILAVTSHATAQTADPYINQLINQANQLMSDPQAWSQNNSMSEVEQQNAYLQQLQFACGQGNAAACDYACEQGNTAACNESNLIHQRRMQRMDAAIQQMRDHYDEDYIDSFRLSGE